MAVKPAGFLVSLGSGGLILITTLKLSLEEDEVDWEIEAVERIWEFTTDELLDLSSISYLWFGWYPKGAALLDDPFFEGLYPEFPLF